MAVKRSFRPACIAAQCGIAGAGRQRRVFLSLALNIVVCIGLHVRAQDIVIVARGLWGLRRFAKSGGAFGDAEHGHDELQVDAYGERAQHEDDGRQDDMQHDAAGARASRTKESIGRREAGDQKRDAPRATMTSAIM